jgi:hypothetical protein
MSKLRRLLAVSVISILFMAASPEGCKSSGPGSGPYGPVQNEPEKVQGGNERRDSGGGASDIVCANRQANLDATSSESSRDKQRQQMREMGCDPR